MRHIDVSGRIYKKDGTDFYTFDLVFHNDEIEHTWRAQRCFSSEILAEQCMNFVGEGVIEILQFRIGELHPLQETPYHALH